MQRQLVEFREFLDNLHMDCFDGTVEEDSIESFKTSVPVMRNNGKSASKLCWDMASPNLQSELFAQPQYRTKEEKMTLLKQELERRRQERRSGKPKQSSALRDDGPDGPKVSLETI